MFLIRRRKYVTVTVEQLLGYSDRKIIKLSAGFNPDDPEDNTLRIGRTYHTLLDANGEVVPRMLLNKHIRVIFEGRSLAG